MSGGVEKKSAEMANPAYIYPPTARAGYEPPNVHDGYNKFIGDILNEGNCDSFQGPPPEEGKKRESRIQQFLKWSGIAFAAAMGFTILKKALTYAGKGAGEAVKEGVKHAKP